MTDFFKRNKFAVLISCGVLLFLTLITAVGSGYYFLVYTYKPEVVLKKTIADLEKYQKLSSDIEFSQSFSATSKNGKISADQKLTGRLDSSVHDTKTVGLTKGSLVADDKSNIDDISIFANDSEAYINYASVKNKAA